MVVRRVRHLWNLVSFVGTSSQPCKLMQNILLNTPDVVLVLVLYLCCSCTYLYPSLRVTQSQEVLHVVPGVAGVLTCNGGVYHLVQAQGAQVHDRDQAHHHQHYQPRLWGEKNKGQGTSLPPSPCTAVVVVGGDERGGVTSVGGGWHAANSFCFIGFYVSQIALLPRMFSMFGRNGKFAKASRLVTKLQSQSLANAWKAKRSVLITMCPAWRPIHTGAELYTSQIPSRIAFCSLWRCPHPIQTKHNSWVLCPGVLPSGWLDRQTRLKWVLLQQKTYLFFYTKFWPNLKSKTSLGCRCNLGAIDWVSVESNSKKINSICFTVPQYVWMGLCAKRRKQLKSYGT